MDLGDVMLLSTFHIPMILRQGPDEAGRVSAFVRSARTGLDPAVVLPPFPEPGQRPTISTSFNTPEEIKFGPHSYLFAHAMVVIDPVSGRISAYHDSSNIEENRNEDGSLIPRRVTDGQALSLAKRFFRYAGWPGEIEPVLQTRAGGEFDVLDGQGDQEESLGIVGIPVAEGVRYDESRWEVFIEVNRLTGQLQDFSFPARFIPAPPLNVTPRGSLEEARLVGLRTGVDMQGESVSESSSRPFQLRIWYPIPDPELPDIDRRAYSSSVRESVQAKRGVLAYVGVVSGSTYESKTVMVIDAMTGAVLEATHPYHRGSAGGAGGGAPALPKPTIADLSKPHTWRVGLPTKGWSSWSAPVLDRLALSKASAPKEAAPVTLAWDRRATQASYAVKTNTLVFDGQTYQPGASLAKLLRKSAGKTK